MQNFHGNFHNLFDENWVINSLPYYCWNDNYLLDNLFNLMNNRNFNYLFHRSIYESRDIVNNYIVDVDRNRYFLDHLDWHFDIHGHWIEDLVPDWERLRNTVRH